jgi:hypothetical protein
MAGVVTLPEACRILARDAEALIAELDPDDEGTAALRRIAGHLRTAGGENPQPVPFPLRLLRLVKS